MVDLWNMVTLWLGLSLFIGLACGGVAVMIWVLRELTWSMRLVLAMSGGLAATWLRGRGKKAKDLVSPSKRQDKYTEGEQVVMGFRRQPFVWTAEHIPNETIDSWEWRTDLVGDAVFQPGMGTDAYESAIAETAKMPEWLDWELLDDGCRFFVQLWPFIFYSFGWAVLGGFGAESASAVLLESRYWAAKGREGQLDTWNRLRETACWLFDVAAHGADGFREGGTAWKACLHVRYLHTRTRKHIQATGRWNKERFGEPINQAQIAGTLLGSSVVLLQGMEEMTGIRFPGRQREAFIHLWRAIGFLFGLDDDVNPNRSYHSAEVAMESILNHGIPAFPDPSLSGVLAKHICESVATGMREEFGMPASAGVVAAPAWRFLGEQYGSAIGLPRPSSLMQLLGTFRAYLLSAVLSAWFLPGAPRVFERLMRFLFVSMVDSIRQRQPNCRFGMTCPMKCG